MKKSFYLFASAAAMLLTACSSDAPNAPEENGVTGQTLTIQLSSSGDLQTRACRPLQSDEALQSVDKVVVFIGKVTKDGGKDVLLPANIKFRKEIDFSDATNMTTGHGKEKAYTLDVSEYVGDPGTYTVYAVGYSTGSGYTGLPKADKSLDYSINMVLEYTSEANNRGEEIFAGQGTFTVNENTGATGSVLLTRQVSGVYAYVTKIPHITGITENSYLRIVYEDFFGTKLALGRYNTSNLLHNGTTENGANIKYIVNGFGRPEGMATEVQVLAQQKLGDWFSEIKDDATKVISLTARKVHRKPVTRKALYSWVPSLFRFEIV